jgi:hypothetical protein
MVQGDAIRNITGSFVGAPKPWGYSEAIYVSGNAPDEHQHPGGGGWAFLQGQLDVSRVVPTAPEIRPTNMSVRYLMRAAK